MTREEAIKELIRAFDVLDNSCHMDNRRKEAFNMAKMALENKPRFILHSDGKIEQIIEPCDGVLDKIKDEIWDIDDTTVLNPDSFYERKVYVRFSKVIDIIDKYKMESEAAE